MFCFTILWYFSELFSGQHFSIIHQHEYFHFHEILRWWQTFWALVIFDKNAKIWFIIPFFITHLKYLITVWIYYSLLRRWRLVRVTQAPLIRARSLKILQHQADLRLPGRASLTWTLSPSLSIYKQTKNRHETGSNLSSGTRLTVLSKRLGRQR